MFSTKEVPIKTVSESGLQPEVKSESNQKIKKNNNSSKAVKTFLEIKKLQEALGSAVQSNLSPSNQVSMRNKLLEDWNTLAEEIAKIQTNILNNTGSKPLHDTKPAEDTSEETIYPKAPEAAKRKKTVRFLDTVTTVRFVDRPAKAKTQSALVTAAVITGFLGAACYHVSRKNPEQTQRIFGAITNVVTNLAGRLASSAFSLLGRATNEK